MAGALRRAGVAAALPALVGASTLLHWIAGHRLAGLWIMPDEAIYASRALALWRHGSLPLLGSARAGYGVVYPAVVGFPLAVGDVSRGYASLKLLQALVMSLAAVPVYVYGTRLMPRGYALLAAALTVASPLLLYSGLVMTEVAFYPIATLTLLAVAHAVATATRHDQAIALVLIGASVATRVQAIVFVAVFGAAIAVDAVFARDRSRLRAFWPVWIALALVAIAVVAAPSVLGAYSSTVGGGYPLGRSLRLAFDHLALIVLMVAVVPAAAALSLLINGARGRERDPEARSLLAVALSSVVLVVVQVGFFAARFAPHLLGRDLAALPPLLFLLFALWLARGAPRRRPVAAPAVLAVLACVALAPWNGLATDTALPDTFDVALLQRAHWPAADVVAVAAAVLLALFVFLPRRLILVLPALVAATLVTSSVVASNIVAARVSDDQSALVGEPHNWVDRATDEPVAYVFNDPPTWNVVWQQRFWNRRITNVLSLGHARVPGPMHQAHATVPADGVLPLRQRFVVANDLDEFVGSPVAEHPLGPDSYGLTLWQLAAPARLSTVLTDIKPNGDMYAPGRVTAYDCGGGRLRLTLLPKATDVVEIFLDGRRVLRQRITGLPSWHGTIAVPPSPQPRVCHFTIGGGVLLGSTVIAFERPS